MKYESLPWKDGQINPSGIRPLAYFIPKTDIATFPTIEHDAAATAKDAVTYSGDFILKADATWKTLYTTQGKGKVTFEGVGEKDCKMFTNKATLSYPDINDAALSLAKGSVNSNLIFVIPLPMNRYKVIGCADYDVTVDMKGDSGDAPGSAKGLSIELTAPDVVPLPGYTGELKFDGGTLDCDTGEFTTVP